MASNQGILKINGEDYYPCPYVVGDLYITTNSENPSNKYGGTTWELFGPGRTMVCVNTSDTPLNAAKKTGGSTNPLTNHTHIQNPHNHRDVGETADGHTNSIVTGSGTALSGATRPTTYGWTNNGRARYSTVISTTATNQNTGDNTNHANWQPFITCYMWLRTA